MVNIYTFKSEFEDKGLSIKNISDKLVDYSHTYERVGEYKVTFVVTNGNFEYNSQIIKEYTIRVVE